MKKQQTGNEDQRYVNREDHDAARRWFEKKARQQDGRMTRQDRLDNLRRLRESIDALDIAPKESRHGRNPKRRS